MIGTKIAHFEITALLGSGGMGEVYKAHDTRLDRTVAIKVLSQHLASTPEAKTRLEREAKAIAALIIHTFARSSTSASTRVRITLSWSIWTVNLWRNA